MAIPNYISGTFPVPGGYADQIIYDNFGNKSYYKNGVKIYEETGLSQYMTTTGTSYPLSGQSGIQYWQQQLNAWPYHQPKAAQAKPEPKKKDNALVFLKAALKANVMKTISNSMRLMFIACSLNMSVGAIILGILYGGKDISINSAPALATYLYMLMQPAWIVGVCWLSSHRGLKKWAEGLDKKED